MHRTRPARTATGERPQKFLLPLGDRFVAGDDDDDAAVGDDDDGDVVADGGVDDGDAVLTVVAAEAAEEVVAEGPDQERTAIAMD